MAQINIVIPSFNRAPALVGTLLGLGEQSISPARCEVIVVDDGSTDETAAVVCSQAFPYKFHFEQQRNQGAGAARNLGASLARGELLIFLDADMTPAPELVQAYWQAYQAQPQAVLIGRILAAPEAFQTLFDRVTRMEHNHDLGAGQVEPAFYHLASGNFAIGLSTFDRLGGFDPALRMTEDTDLGYRAWQAGLPIVYCPAAVGYHNHPKSFAQRLVQVRSSAYWTAHLMGKHPGLRGALPIYNDITPLSWGKRDAATLARKLGRQALASGPLRRSMLWAVEVLEKTYPRPKLLDFFYWKIMSAERVIGFRNGLKSIPLPGSA